MKLVKILKKEGVNKQDIFYQAVDAGLKAKKVTRYLASYPDQEQSKEYNTANRIFVGLYAVLILLNLFSALPVFLSLPLAGVVIIVAIALILPSVVIYLILQKYAIGYLIFCVFQAKGILDAVRLLDEGPLSVLIGMAISVVMIVYAVILKYKLFPYQNFLNIKKDSEGLTVFTYELRDHEKGVSSHDI